jgi:protein-disulfide isomerase
MSTTTKKDGAGANPASGRVQRRRQEARRAKRRKLLELVGAVAIAFAVAVGLILISQGGDDMSDSSAADFPAVVAASPIEAGIPSDGRTLGNPDAPVTLVEYADYQCPYCGAFNRDIMPSLIRDYVATGKVKLEFRDLPFLDDGVSDDGESDMAAEAAACAMDQGKFWQFHDTLFLNQHGENEGAFSKTRLQAMANAVGLDMNAFDACLDGKTHQAEIAAEQAEAQQRGVTSTPTLYLNDRKLTYTGSYEDLKRDLDAALAG